ncbi:MAG TPA: NAD(P)/FAD-dependent oxidoreductase [Spirochaetota bacterium]|nr:NAD(P)/FAD-dependent oxidoreductase [Spirochaetota bacterium]HRX48305.1 NAD(P)/FAD-dependent oxidoreductase [Spirochaetota bacterium]
MTKTAKEELYMSDYDVIIIGAGNGGLTASAALAQAGKKVLLLEKHNIPGGCGTSFRRGRFEFEVALHQLSGMGSAEKPGPLRHILKKLEIEDKIEWVEMDKLYRVVLPGRLDITLPAEKEAAIKYLEEKFPAEKEQFRKFYDFVYKYLFESFTVSKTPEDQVEREKFPLYFKYNLKSSQEVMDEFFKDPLIHLSLNVYWSFMGLPPSKLPFDILAGNIFIYMEFKPYHLKGGSQVMSTALTETVLKYGGDIKFNCGAEKIIVEGGAVRGVLTEHGDKFTAPYVVSNISPVRTYVDMIDESLVPEETLYNMGNSRTSVSAFTLYIGLDCEPEKLGFKESMNLFYALSDVNDSFAAARRLDTDEDGFIVSCYTLDDPHFSPAGTSQVVVVCLKYGEPWMELPPELYHETKYRCADTLLRRVEEQFPGFREHIEEIEVATPLTHLRYLGHPNGAVYGFDQDLKDTGIFMQKKSPIQGLYFASGWVEVNGFQPTLTAGYSTARRMLKKMNGEGK